MSRVMAARRAVRRVKRRPEWHKEPAWRVPSISYAETAEKVRAGECEWQELLCYDTKYAPAPELVGYDVLEVNDNTLGTADWADLMKYFAVRCGQEPHHYRTCFQAALSLQRQLQGGNDPQVASALAGIALYAGDAEGAVRVLRSTNAFSGSTYTWAAWPLSLWPAREDGAPLSRLHLHAMRFYSAKVRAGHAPTSLGVHAFLHHAVLRDDVRLFWDVVRAVCAEWHPSSPPPLLAETTELLLAALRDAPADPETHNAVRAMLAASGKEFASDKRAAAFTAAAA